MFSASPSGEPELEVCTGVLVYKLNKIATIILTVRENARITCDFILLILVLYTLKINNLTFYLHLNYLN